MGSQWKVINSNYKNMEGYKRVAWPPVSEERIVREFTPQPAVSAAAAVPASAAVQQPLYNNVKQKQQWNYNYQQEKQEEERYEPQMGRAASVTSYVPQYQQQQQQQQHEATPIQYKQAQFQRYGSQETENEQQQHYGEKFGWKPIRGPVAKPQNQYYTQICSQTLPQQEQYQQQQQQYQPNYQQQQQPGWTGQQYQASSAPQYQPQVDSSYNNNHNNNSNSYYAQQRHPQHQPNYQTHQYNIQQNQSANQATYNSNSQFQQQHQQPRAQSLSQDLVDQSPATGHSLPQEYRGGSPGIIQLRKEAPINQKPNLVYTSQPAAVHFQGGSNMRGDLKWPPQEYKEAAAKENEERRKLALGPVCRPRKVNRDYSGFFAKNAINSYYPSYKVPPGTQHMLV